MPSDRFLRHDDGTITFTDSVTGESLRVPGAFGEGRARALEAADPLSNLGAAAPPPPPPPPEPQLLAAAPAGDAARAQQALFGDPSAQPNASPATASDTGGGVPAGLTIAPGATFAPSTPARAAAAAGGGDAGRVQAALGVAAVPDQTFAPAGDVRGLFPQPGASSTPAPRGPAGPVRMRGGGDAGGGAGGGSYGIAADLARRMALAPNAPSGGGGPVRTVRQQTGETIVTEGAPSAATMGAFEGVARQDAANKKLEGEIADEKGERRAEQLKGLESVSAQHDKGVALARERERYALEQNQKEREALLEDIRTTDTSPKAFWGSKTTGEKIAAGIALAFGAVAQGIKGGENQALLAINRVVDDDMAARRERLATKKEGLGELDKAYQRVKARTGDEVAALLETKAAALAQLKSTFERQSLEIGDPEVNKDVSIRNARIQADLDRSIAQLHAQADERVKTSASFAFKQVGGGGGGGLTAKQRLEFLEKAGDLESKAVKAAGGAGGDGFVVNGEFHPFAPGLSDGEKAEVRKKASLIESTQRSLLDFEKRRGFTGVDPTGELEQQAKGIISNKYIVAGQGQTSDGQESAGSKSLLRVGSKAAAGIRGDLNRATDEMITQYSQKARK